MDMKESAKKALRKAPGVGKYLTHHHNQLLAQEEVIKKLEARNDEWAAEVRELRGAPKPMEILWPVTRADIIAADLRKKMHLAPTKPHSGPYTFNWVVPPVGSVSGGHAVIFRLINFLESQGHTCRVYFYDPLNQSTFEQTTANLVSKHHKIKAELFYNEETMLDADASIATSWPTAYPVRNFQGTGKKFYLIQDYETVFEPSGTYSALADNTYRMGLHAISTTPGTTEILKDGYDIKKIDTIELAVNQGEYTMTNTAKRKKILFYARPVTPRRGFELGVLTLELFHAKHPEYEIVFLGWDIAPYVIPFPYTNRGIISTEEQNKLYNECAAGLVLSFTSISLMTVEIMAAGCQPVVNETIYTKMVGYTDGLAYAQPTPQALADALSDAVTNPNALANAKRLSTFSEKFTWEKSEAEFMHIFDRELGQ